MHFSKQDSYYSVSHITGPNHNLLLVAFADNTDISRATIESLPPIGPCQHGALDASAILQAVLDGIDDGNAKFGKDYRVIKVKYIENDAPPEAVYRFMAFKLIEYLAEQHNGS